MYRAFRFQILCASLGVAGLWSCARNHAPDVHAAQDAAILDDSAEPDAGIIEPGVDAGTDAAGNADVPARPRRVSISATGDLVIHPRMISMALANRDRGRFGAVVGRVAALLSNNDVAFLNLETPLSTTHRPPGGRLEALVAPPQFARDLSRVGFDVVSVANNHAYDQTADGTAETLDAVHAAGMAAVGAGRTDEEAYGPWIVERDGVRTAFFGFTVRTNDGPGSNAQHIRIARVEAPEQAIAAITAARPNVDVIVVSVHWSRDFVAAISDQQRSIARRMIAAGADLILGTGTHLLQRVERMPSPRGEAVVAYSLGNLVSNFGHRYRVGQIPNRPGNPLMFNPAARDGVMLRVTFEVPGPGAVTVSALTGVVLWTINTDEEIRVVPLRAMDEDTRRERMHAVTTVLGPAVRLRP